jgi:hypothetical protein
MEGEEPLTALLRLELERIPAVSTKGRLERSDCPWLPPMRPLGLCRSPPTLGGTLRGASTDGKAAAASAGGNPPHRFRAPAAPPPPQALSIASAVALCARRIARESGRKG